jgi:hypothetical protein
MSYYLYDILPSKIETQSDENKKIAQEFINKLKSFAHAPLNKKHGLRLLPFIEQKELVSLVADVIKDYELRLLPNSYNYLFDVVGYYYCIDLLALYVLNRKDGFGQILSLLEHEAEKEIACRRLKLEYGGKDAGLMLRVLKFYEDDTDAFNALIARLT